MSRLALLVTGASGMRLPVRALAVLAAYSGIERLHLVVSAGAAKVLAHELPGDDGGRPAERLVAASRLSGRTRERIVVHGDQELDAPLASGSYRLDATIVLPCSSGTLGALASGTTTTLIHRAGLVALKEGWPLVLGFRETPFNLVHVENMRRLIRAGATLLPPIPAFYVGGETLDRFLDAYVLRLLDCAGLGGGDPAVEDELRWHGGAGREGP